MNVCLLRLIPSNNEDISYIDQYNLMLKFTWLFTLMLIDSVIGGNG